MKTTYKLDSTGKVTEQTTEYSDLDLRVKAVEAIASFEESQIPGSNLLTNAVEAIYKFLTTKPE